MRSHVDAGPRVLFFDADGTLFPSEAPAFEASAQVVNELLSRLDIPTRYTAEELRSSFTGMNFRAVAAELCHRAGKPLTPDILDTWVRTEKDVVTTHLARTLRPHVVVSEALSTLQQRFDFAVVTSSATVRLNACLTTTALSEFFPRIARFSAEDTLPRPVSKPHPDIYELALARMNVERAEALAVEDSDIGVRSAVAAGLDVVGLLQFVPRPERASRSASLMAAGANQITDSWPELAQLLLDAPTGNTSMLPAR